ncbi:MAG TPA: LytTR family DNA-binding domain-containing protein [Paenibacillaceae bacterium]
MSVFHLLDEEGRPRQIGVDDILMICPTSQGPQFHTRDGVYYYPYTLDEFLLLLGPRGFERLDRNNIVNMRQIRRYDPKTRTVFFDDREGPDVLYATVSEANTCKVARLFREREERYAVAAAGAGR